MVAERRNTRPMNPKLRTINILFVIEALCWAPYDLFLLAMKKVVKQLWNVLAEHYYRKRTHGKHGQDIPEVSHIIEF